MTRFSVGLSVSATLLLFTLTTHAYDGTVNITGRITDNTCVVSADSTALTVDMGNIAKAQFTRAGEGGAYQPFTLHLERCGEAAKRVSVTFSGIQDTVAPDFLRLDTNTSGAQGVALALYNSDQTLIPLNTPSAATDLVTNQANVTLSFYARFLANASPVRSGSATASTTFTMNYD